MRLLFVVDGRSPIALNWISYFVAQGHEVHLASTFPCNPGLNLAGLYQIPVAFSQAAGDFSPGGQGGGIIRKVLPIELRTRLRQWLGPLTLGRAARQLRSLLETIEPDLVHAMRIPYEGMVSSMAAAMAAAIDAATAGPAAPLVVSVWGNDFTLHAPATPVMRRRTRFTLERANALHADCQRDIRLAWSWGFSKERPYRVLPGGGGIQLDLFYPPGREAETGPDAPLVVNPRGFRAYVRNDVFFQAIPLVLARRPEARFTCPTMQGESQATAWAQSLGIAESIDLLPRLSRPEMAELFRSAQVVVSPSAYDGTPNTLLEAMACGCFPVAGDLESLREWITPGVNGLLVEVSDPQALADAIVLALDRPELRERVATHNRALVEERAEYGRVMEAAEEFYTELASEKNK